METELAVEEGVKRVLVAGHVGKLIKVAGGVRNTHSKYGDRRMEILGRMTREVLEGDGSEIWGERKQKWKGLRDSEIRERLLRGVEGANTTEEAVGRLKEAGIAELVLACGAKHVKEQILLWSEGALEAEVIMFSSVHEVAGRTGKDLWRGWL